LKVVEKTFALDHPCAAGHFPGNPIIPGAVLLDEVLQAVEQIHGGSVGACVIKSAKFFRPTRPGERVAIRLETLANGDVRFECRVREHAVAAGTLALGPPPEARP
jgi:3-hydroxyacyl-[acyl-carrier-protein] dehydratase